MDQSTYIYGHNKSVLINSSNPDTCLKKKINSITYHFFRKGSARDEWRHAYVKTQDNPFDLMTKCLPPGEKRVKFVRSLTHHMCSVCAKTISWFK